MGDYKLEIVRDYYGKIDPFYLSKKDPNYEYRFLRDEGKNMMMKRSNLLFQKGGWQVVPVDHLKRLGIPEEEWKTDGMLRRGDTILAFMPKSLYEEKEKYKQEQANAPMKSIKRMLKEGDSGKSGQDIHPSLRGIQTQKDLGM